MSVKDILKQLVRPKKVNSEVGSQSWLETFPEEFVRAEYNKEYRTIRKERRLFNQNQF